MEDKTENVRRAMQVVINQMPAEVITEAAPQTWTTLELQRDFDVEGFMAPFVVVRRKADGVRGTMLFKHDPRIYFEFQEDRA